MVSFPRTFRGLPLARPVLPLLRPFLSSSAASSLASPAFAKSSPSSSCLLPSQRLFPSQNGPFNSGRRTMHTTPPLAKLISGPLNPNTSKDADKKVYILRRFRAKRLPAPLRMGRNRYLRHWVIHRGWMLYLRQERRRRELELMRMQQGISNALEELRKTSGPAHRDEGYLYRRAIEKRGVWDIHSIPIEYARMQVETPARKAWDHDWKAPAT